MTPSALTRREALRRGAGLALLASGGLLTACGGDEPLGPQAEAIARRSIAIDYASYYAPYPDLRRLVEARAHRRGALVRFSDDPSGAAAQAQSLRRLTGEHGGFRVVAVAPFDAAAVDPIAADAIGRGVKIVSHLVPLAHQTAAIAVDETRAAALLADHARAWARRSGRSGGVLIVGPPERAVVPDPFLPCSAKVRAALERELAPGALGDVATTTAVGEADAAQAVAAALRADPRIDVVLTTADTTALGAAQAIGGREGGYVGAVAAAGISGPAALETLDGGTGPLRCLVAPRLRDLAHALVDVPLGLLRGARPSGLEVLAARLTPGSAEIDRFRSDYRD